MTNDNLVMAMLIFSLMMHLATIGTFFFVRKTLLIHQEIFYRVFVNACKLGAQKKIKSLDNAQG